jgi:Holliday junction resolvase
MKPKINARVKGCAFERQIAKELRELGWKDCVTSRYGSKEMDDAKVDLLFTNPYSIQIKATERTPSYHDILSEMPQNENINIIIHKRNRKGEVVVMWKSDFYKLIKP